jgi:hypothetical protein
VVVVVNWTETDVDTEVEISVLSVVVTVEATVLVILSDTVHCRSLMIQIDTRGRDLRDGSACCHDRCHNWNRQEARAVSCSCRAACDIRRLRAGGIEAAQEVVPVAFGCPVVKNWRCKGARQAGCHDHQSEAYE